MLRIIDGVPYLGKKASWVKLQAVDLGNGHLEVSGYCPTVWEEADWTPDYLEAVRELIAQHEAERDQAELRALHADQAAKRAKKRVRQLCKAGGVDTLLTLTYRANEVDLAKCKADLKEFVRRLRRVVPGFCAVAGFERQERGAWHVHLACRRFDRELDYRGVKLPSFNVIRAVWRSVTGVRGGNVDVQSRKRNSKRSPARIAAYIAKYITKEFAEGEAWSNRWTKFGTWEVPAKVELGLFADMRQALVAAFDLAGDGQGVVNARISRWSDSFFVFFERPS